MSSPVAPNTSVQLFSLIRCLWMFVIHHQPATQTPTQAGWWPGKPYFLTYIARCCSFFAKRCGEPYSSLAQEYLAGRRHTSLDLPTQLGVLLSLWWFESLWGGGEQAMPGNLSRQVCSNTSMANCLWRGQCWALDLCIPTCPPMIDGRAWTWLSPFISVFMWCCCFFVYTHAFDKNIVLYCVLIFKKEKRKIDYCSSSVVRALEKAGGKNSFLFLKSVYIRSVAM